MASSDQYVEFGIGTEKYALNISDIHEIIRMQHITEIPGGNSRVIGVIHLRGKIIPIISLRSLFGLQNEAPTKRSRIIVVFHRADMVGISWSTMSAKSLHSAAFSLRRTAWDILKAKALPASGSMTAAW